MKKLIDLFAETDLEYIISINNDIMNMSDNELNNKINLLNKIELNDENIKNIIYANPYFLTNNFDDIGEIIDFFSNNFTNTNLLFEANPYLLNKKIIDIKFFINKKSSEGFSYIDIINMIDDNPYIMEE